MKASFKQIGYVKVLANANRDSAMMMKALKRELTPEEADEYIKLNTGRMYGKN